MKNIVYLSGLPRSGSTLLSNLLAMHPEISSTPSSPLCSIVQSIRRQCSDDPFLLAQLDSSFDRVHNRIKNSIWSFMQEWSGDHKKPIVIDKNRGWIFCAEWLRELDPNAKIIVTLRDLKDVYKSVEKRHRKTLFIDYPDHMEHNLVDGRAFSLFDNGGLIGSVLKGIQNLSDIPNIMNHIYYFRYEDLMSNPQMAMNHLFNAIGVDSHTIDFNNIIQSTQESDSYYRFKYTHKIKSKLSEPVDDTPISPRILEQIESKFQWYNQQFYSDIAARKNVIDNDLNTQMQEQTAMPDRSNDIIIQNVGQLNDAIIKQKDKQKNGLKLANNVVDDADMIAKLEQDIQKETAPNPTLKIKK